MAASFPCIYTLRTRLAAGLRLKQNLHLVENGF